MRPGSWSGAPHWTPFRARGQPPSPAQRRRRSLHSRRAGLPRARAAPEPGADLRRRHGRHVHRPGARRAAARSRSRSSLRRRTTPRGPCSRASRPWCSGGRRCSRGSARAADGARGTRVVHGTTVAPQRAPDRPPGARRAGHQPRLPRPARDRPPGPARALRAAPGQARADRAARAALRGRPAHLARPRARSRPSARDRAPDAGGARRAWPARSRARARESIAIVPLALVRRSRDRAPRGPRARAARPADHLLGGAARRVPRGRALLDGRGERGARAGDARLPRRGSARRSAARDWSSCSRAAARSRPRSPPPSPCASCSPAPPAASSARRARRTRRASPPWSAWTWAARAPTSPSAPPTAPRATASRSRASPATRWPCRPSTSTPSAAAAARSCASTRGVLRVGPESAGATPGPACYGQSDEPTLTDAHLVLGHLDPRACSAGRWRSTSAPRTRAFERLGSARRRRSPARVRALAESALSRGPRRHAARALGDDHAARPGPRAPAAGRLRRRRRPARRGACSRALGMRAALVPRPAGRALGPAA